MKKIMKNITADIDEILHEWHTPKAERILKEMGVSERNWRFFALHNGYADGTRWSLREIAEMEDDISHVRIWQIVKTTEKRLRKYMMSRMAK